MQTRYRTSVLIAVGTLFCIGLTFPGVGNAKSVTWSDSLTSPGFYFGSAPDQIDTDVEVEYSATVRNTSQGNAVVTDGSTVTVGDQLQVTIDPLQSNDITWTSGNYDSSFWKIWEEGVPRDGYVGQYSNGGLPSSVCNSDNVALISVPICLGPISWFSSAGNGITGIPMGGGGPCPSGGMFLHPVWVEPPSTSVSGTGLSCSGTTCTVTNTGSINLRVTYASTDLGIHYLQSTTGQTPMVCSEPAAWPTSPLLYTVPQQTIDFSLSGDPAGPSCGPTGFDVSNFFEYENRKQECQNLGYTYLAGEADPETGAVPFVPGPVCLVTWDQPGPGYMQAVYENPACSTPSTPSAPTITATPSACGTGQIDVTWDPVPGASTYRIRVDGGSWQNLGTSNSFTHTGLIAGSGHNYIVRAVNSAGQSADSNRPGVYAPPDCPIDGACGTRATSYAYTDTAWPGGSTYCASGFQTANAAFPAAGASSIWHCYGQNMGNDSGQCVAARAAAPGCGTAAGGTYTTQPSSNLCTTGSATWSDTTANDGEFNWSCAATACTANHQPDAPTNLVVSVTGSCGSGELYLDWDDVVGADSYSVYFSDGTHVGNSLGSNYSTFVGTPGQTYTFYVRANSPLGIQSVNSATDSGTPGTCPPTAQLEVRVVPGGWGTNSILVGAEDTLELRWSSNHASGCIANAGPGFSTGNAVSGTDTTIITPTAGNNSTFNVNCDGADSGIIVTSDFADLGDINVTHTPSTTVDPATGNYDSVTVTFNTRNLGLSSTVVNPEYRMEYQSTLTSPASIGILAGNQASANLSQTFSDVPFGPFEVTVRVDTGNDVSESDETNNEYVYQIDLSPPDPQLELIVDPAIVREDQTSTLTWNTPATYPLECSVQGPGVSVTDNTAPYSGSTTVGPVSSKSTYTFTCTESVSGTSWSETVAVEVLGTFEEI